MNVRIGSFWANIVFKHFPCSICISRAQSTWKINMDLIKAQHHQCCCCVELITRVLREISSIVFLYNVSIDEGVPRSSSNWLSNWALDMQMKHEKCLDMMFHSNAQIAQIEPILIDMAFLELASIVQYHALKPCLHIGSTEECCLSRKKSVVRCSSALEPWSGG